MSTKTSRLIATIATAPMLGGPPPCTRDPIHSAISGAKVQMLTATIAIAQSISSARPREGKFTAFWTFTVSPCLFALPRCLLLC